MRGEKNNPINSNDSDPNADNAGIDDIDDIGAIDDNDNLKACPTIASFHTSDQRDPTRTSSHSLEPLN